MASNKRTPKFDGKKFTQEKPNTFLLFQDFPLAFQALAQRATEGAEKHTYKWDELDNGLQRYSSAMMRHIVDEQIDGPVDPDSPSESLHATGAVWNALARLELILRGEE